MQLGSCPLPQSPLSIPRHSWTPWTLGRIWAVRTSSVATMDYRSTSSSPRSLTALPQSTAHLLGSCCWGKVRLNPPSHVHPEKAAGES